MRYRTGPAPREVVSRAAPGAAQTDRGHDSGAGGRRVLSWRQRGSCPLSARCCFRKRCSLIEPRHAKAHAVVRINVSRLR